MKKILFIITILISVFIINNLVRSIYTLWQKRSLLESAQKELENKKTENKILQDKLLKAERTEFVEKEARNKLFLSKEGETRIIIPSSLIESQKPLQNKISAEKPNWKKWLDIFHF